MDLIKLERINDCDVVDSRLIAMELGIKHINLMGTIRKYQDRLEKKGVLQYETETVTNSVGAVNLVKFAYLNERQATFVLTLSRNTEQVVNLKDKLEESFYQAKQAIANQIKTPQTYLEALKALVASEEEKEQLKLINQSLEKENEQLSESVDELFNYSSIIRVAKFNQCSETNFAWRKLKAVSQQLGVEIKKVPCPRFETKNLYSHDAWRIAYPGVKLPETTTLVIS